MLQAYEAAVAKLFAPARQVLRHDVRMDIYLERHVREIFGTTNKEIFLMTV